MFESGVCLVFGRVRALLFVAAAVYVFARVLFKYRPIMSLAAAPASADTLYILLFSPVLICLYCPT